MRIVKLLTGTLTLLAVVSMTACGNGDRGKDDEQLTLSIGYTTAANENDPYHFTASRFKEIVEKNSNGRITVNLYASSQLGSEPEMWEGMQIGTCDMAVMTNAYVSSYVRANGALDLPFIFTDLDQAREVLDGEFGQALIDNMEGTGVTCLAYSEGGFRQLCTKKAGIWTPEDLKGMKVRCMETKIYLSAYEALGVNATPMAW